MAERYERPVARSSYEMSKRRALRTMLETGQEVESEQPSQGCTTYEGEFRRWSGSNPCEVGPRSTWLSEGCWSVFPMLTCTYWKARLVAWRKAAS
jgi:hypothetical protein